MMDCEVQDVKKNMRYKILTIDGKSYILDIRPSWWKNLFPLLFWLTPFRVFRIENKEILERLKSTEIKQKASANTVFLAGGIGVFISNLFLDPLVEYLNLQTPWFMNILIAVFATLLVISLRSYIAYNNQTKVQRIVTLEELSSCKLWIRPKTIGHFFQVAIVYLWFLILAITGYMLYIGWGGNIFILLVASSCLFVILIVGKITIKEGWTRTKFKHKS